MVHPGRFPRRAAAAAALLAIGALFAVRPSPAAAASNVTAVNGSAFGFHAFNISVFGGAQPEIGPAPTATVAADASNSPQSATATTGVVAYGPATLFTSDGISAQASGSLGSTGSVTASSSVSDVNKATTQKGTGSEALTADTVSASCSGSSSGSSGSTTIANGTLVTDNRTTPPTVVNVPASPSVDTTISGTVQAGTSTDSFHYVFNEQTTDAAGNLTVNAVDEYFDGPTLKGNLIIGQVVCGMTTIPATNLSVQNPPITHTPDPVPAGGSVTFTVTVSNLGPNDAPGVVVVATPTGGRLTAVAPSTGTCATSKGKTKGGVSCSLGTIAAGQSATVQITVGAPHKGGGTISVSSTVSSPADDNTANNTATDSVSVQ